MRLKLVGTVLQNSEREVFRYFKSHLLDDILLGYISSTSNMD